MSILYIFKKAEECMSMMRKMENIRKTQIELVERKKYNI